MHFYYISFNFNNWLLVSNNINMNNKYHKYYYMVTVRDNDNYDSDFTNKTKAIEYAKGGYSS